jgi:hypothetical protein
VLFFLIDLKVAKPDYSEAKIVVAMVNILIGMPFVGFDHLQVGLPARGKSYLSNKLMIYLRVRTHLRLFLLALLKIRSG